MTGYRERMSTCENWILLGPVVGRLYFVVDIKVNEENFQAEDDDADSVDSSENSPSVLGSPPADMSFDSSDLPLYNNVSLNKIICMTQQCKYLLTCSKYNIWQ